MSLVLSKADLAYCRDLQKTHGTSYFFATRFLPKRHRPAVHVLYAFFRLPDEIVDQIEGRSVEEVRQALSRWRSLWKKARTGEEVEEPILRLANRVFAIYGIPDEEADAFFDSMEMDIERHTYASYGEIERYMYGSAAIVGRMMTRILGYTSEEAFSHAEALGYAMQWTNFLRDIDEDWRERKRIYLPADRLEAHGLSEDQIANRLFSPAFSALMKEEIARADALYKQAEEGIRLLHPSGRLGVLVSARLYQEILRMLEKQERNPFMGRARTSLFRKCGVAFRAWRDLKTKPLFKA